MSASSAARCGQPARAVLAHLDDLGQQQRLALHALGLELVLELLVQQALVRGVLVDDHHALVGLRHDVGLVQLRARHAQRIVLAVAVAPSTAPRPVPTARRAAP